MKIENPDDIYTYEIDVLWVMLNVIIEESEKEYKVEKEAIKNGINLKVPIWYFTKTWYEEYPSSKKIKILGHGKFPINTFMEEKEKRERIMRKIIIENMDDEAPGEPRN